MALAFADVEGGSTLRVRVVPGAKRERIVGVHGEALKIAVQQPPERGRANRDVCRLFAESIGIPPRDVTVARGQTSRDKTLRAAGLDAETLGTKVAALLVTLGAS